MKQYIKLILADGNEMEVSRDVLLRDAETGREIAAGDAHPDRVVLVPGEREKLVPQGKKLVKVTESCLHRAMRDERDWKRDRKFHRDGSATGVPSMEAPLLSSARRISKAWEGAKHTAPTTLNEAPAPSCYTPPGEVDRALNAPVARKKKIAEPAFDKVHRGAVCVKAYSLTLDLWDFSDAQDADRGQRVRKNLLALLRDDAGAVRVRGACAEFGGYAELEEGVKYVAEYLARLGYTVWR